MSTIRTTTDLLNLADRLASDLIQNEAVKAAQAVELAAVKTSHKPTLDALRRGIANLKRRLSTWINNHAGELFDGAETGTVRTNLIEIQRRNDPPKLVPLDDSLDEEDLINRALALGFDQVVESVPRIRKEALESLEDEDLKRLGWRRERGSSIHFRPLADKERKTSSKVA